MKFDFSIESSIESIHNTNTKEYFKEVYQTFINGNYRSSIVMLYSVLICDLVYKLRDLRDIYGETSAKKILSEIETMQKNNPTSPEWESKLIEFIKIRTSFFESSDIVAIESLQKFRHLSAHPVLNSADLLYSPNRETVQSLIRNILEGVLTNPPFFSNKIFDTMLLDLAEVKDKIGEPESIERYVKSRYLKHLKENDFKKVYRSLWKISFITDDDDSKENGYINYYTLKVFTAYDKNTCFQLLKTEPNYYSNINKDGKLGTLVHFLASFPELYPLLDQSLKLLLDNKLKDEGDFQFMGWFKSSTLTEHLKSLDVSILYNISSEAFEFIQTLATDNGCKDELINFAINYFGESSSFDECRKRYNAIITCIVDDLNVNQMKRLLEVANGNSQIYYKWGMKQTLRQLSEKYKEEIDTSIYNSIFKD